MLVVHLAAIAVPLLVVPAIARVAPGAVPRAIARATVAVAPLVAASYLVDRGIVAALLIVPWVGVALVGLARTARTAPADPVAPADPAVRRGLPALVRLTDPADLVVAAYLVVSASALAVSRAGWTFGHLVEPIIELTTVHYGYAGAGTAAIAGVALAHARPRRRPLAVAALVLVVGAAPVVALGFVVRHPLPQVGGAVALTLGIVGVCYVTARDGAARARRAPTTVLLAVAAVAPLVPMGLAVAWAADQHWDVPALDIPAMARTHGLANAVGFVGCGLWGYRRLKEEAPAC